MPKHGRLMPGGFLGTILLGGLAGFFLYSDLSFTAHAVPGRALVRAFWVGYRSSPNRAEVEYRVEGRSILTRIDVGSGHLPVGQFARILYSPDDPKTAILDRFWSKYYRSILALGALELVSLAEATAFVARLRARDRLIGRPEIARLHDDAARAIVGEALAAARHGDGPIPAPAEIGPSPPRES